MSPSGDSVVMGPYVASLAIGQGLTVKHILARYAANPGFFPGDMFLCNDPYSGALHQNDVTSVAPVFHAEKFSGLDRCDDSSGRRRRRFERQPGGHRREVNI